MAAPIYNPAAAAQYASAYNPQRRVNAKVQPQIDPSYDNGAPFIAAYWAAFIGLRSQVNQDLLQRRLSELDPSRMAKEIDRLQQSLARLHSHKTNLQRAQVEGNSKVMEAIVKAIDNENKQRIATSGALAVARTKAHGDILTAELENYYATAEASGLTVEERNDFRAVANASWPDLFEGETATGKDDFGVNTNSVLNSAHAEYRKMGGVRGGTEDRSSKVRALQVYNQIIISGGAFGTTERAEAQKAATQFWNTAMAESYTVEEAAASLGFPLEEVDDIAASVNRYGAPTGGDSQVVQTLKDAGLWDHAIELAGVDDGREEQIYTQAVEELGAIDAELAELHLRVQSDDGLTETDIEVYRAKITQLEREAKADPEGESAYTYQLLNITRPGAISAYLGGEKKSGPDLTGLDSTIKKMESRLQGLYDDYDQALEDGPERYSKVFNDQAQGRNWLLANPYLTETGSRRDVDLVRGLPEDQRAAVMQSADDARAFTDEDLEPVKSEYGNVTLQDRWMAGITEADSRTPQGVQAIYTGSMDAAALAEEIATAARLFEQGDLDSGWTLVEALIANPGSAEAGLSLKRAVDGAHSHNDTRTFVSDLRKVSGAVSDAGTLMQRDVQTGLRETDRPQPYATDALTRGLLEPETAFGFRHMDKYGQGVFYDMAATVQALEEQRESLTGQRLAMETEILATGDDDFLRDLQEYNATKAKALSALKGVHAAQEDGNDGLWRERSEEFELLAEHAREVWTPQIEAGNRENRRLPGQLAEVDTQLDELDASIREKREHLKKSAAYGSFNWQDMAADERIAVLKQRQAYAKDAYDSYKTEAALFAEGKLKEASLEKAEEAWAAHQGYARELDKIEWDAPEREHVLETQRGIDAARATAEEDPLTDGK